MQRLAGAFDVEPSHSLLAPHTHTRTHLEDDINMHMCAHPDVLMCLFQKKKNAEKSAICMSGGNVPAI